MHPKPKQPNTNVDKMASKLHLGMTLDVVEQFFMTRTMRGQLHPEPLGGNYLFDGMVLL